MSVWVFKERATAIRSAIILASFSIVSMYRGHWGEEDPSSTLSLVSQGCTATLGNFTKATFDAISKTYNYLTPHLWKVTVFPKSPYQKFTDYLIKTHARVSMQRT
ncbi:40S ribosomal protein S2 [Plecturocebus cupreus]